MENKAVILVDEPEKPIDIYSKEDQQVELKSSYKTKTAFKFYFAEFLIVAIAIFLITKSYKVAIATFFGLFIALVIPYVNLLLLSAIFAIWGYLGYQFGELIFLILNPTSENIMLSGIISALIFSSISIIIHTPTLKK